MFQPGQVYGVDFSGAKEAGSAIWVAHVQIADMVLHSVQPLSARCGTSERDICLPELVAWVGETEQALWGFDFPFALPVELGPDSWTWTDQLDWLTSWDQSAQDLGRECVARTQRLSGKMHLRRTTDLEVRTPFDCYHYRIIHQTFHGMRQIAAPLTRQPGTAIAPFPHRKWQTAKRVVVETCPSSSLKRWGLPHQNYKQPQGGPLTAKRRETRKILIGYLKSLIAISPAQERILMRNPGGDAIDAVIAAIGTLQAWNSADHQAIAKHPRYPREGKIYA